MTIEFCALREEIQAKLDHVSAQIEVAKSLKASSEARLERSEAKGRHGLAKQCRRNIAECERIIDEGYQLCRELEGVLTSWHDETAAILAERTEAEA